jgi:hypothetical protein
MKSIDTGFFPAAEGAKDVVAAAGRANLMTWSFETGKE